MGSEQNVTAIDSLSANEFKLEIDGQELSGIFRISNFAPFDFAIVGSHERSIVISKMVQRDPNNPFNKWLQESIAAVGADAYPTRTVSIVAVDDGVIARRWHLKKAWIGSVSYSDFNSASNELVEESAVIKYESAEIEWITA